MSGGNGRQGSEGEALAEVRAWAVGTAPWGQDPSRAGGVEGLGSSSADVGRGGRGALEGRPGLLAVLESLGRLPNLTLVAGLGEDGAPILVPLRSRNAWNLLVVGPGASGKSDWIRALALSLALTSTPEDLQIYGVDLTGRQLAVLEAIPHSVEALATNLGAAHELLLGLTGEMDRRNQGGAGRPDLVLVVDDLNWADRPEGLETAAQLGRLWARGWQAGIHILAAGSRDSFRGGGPGLRARASGGRGWFELAGETERALLRPCTLSAWDLDAAVRRLPGGRAL